MAVPDQEALLKNRAVRKIPEATLRFPTGISDLWRRAAEEWPIPLPMRITACAARSGAVFPIDNGRVFFIDENIKIGNGCDLSSFPKEMLCYDSDGSFCRAIPRNNGQKGFVQYVKLSKE